LAQTKPFLSVRFASLLCELLFRAIGAGGHDQTFYKVAVDPGDARRRFRPYEKKSGEMGPWDLSRLFRQGEGLTRAENPFWPDDNDMDV
jgi:hypothetical protein